MDDLYVWLTVSRTERNSLRHKDDGRDRLGNEY
jgi:hypothetical protein